MANSSKAEQVPQSRKNERERLSTRRIEWIPIKILKRAWYILWSYRALWVFGLVLALAAGSSSGQGSTMAARYEQSGNENHQFTPAKHAGGIQGFQHEVDKLLSRESLDMDISGEALTPFSGSSAFSSWSC